MSTRDGAWPDGTPCWVDLVVDDVGAACAFYGELFGWTTESGPPKPGGYTMCLLKGRTAAGIGPRPEGVDMPSVWSTYLAADDVDATVGKIKAAGGQLLMDPFDVHDAGRMAIGFDSTGAAFGLWQSAAHVGARIVNEPGALTWNECMSRDYEKCQAFYADVFGHGFDEVGDGETFRYSVIKVGGAPVGGMGELSAEMPPEIPAHWMVYFGSSDTDATVGKARSLGGEVRIGPTDTPYGRMAVLQGVQGEVFSVISV